jgi:hypothetical protein
VDQFENRLRKEGLEGKRVELLASIWAKTKDELESHYSQPSLLSSAALPAVIIRKVFITVVNGYHLKVVFFFF